MDVGSAAPFVPPTRRLDDLRAAAQACTGCPLHCDTTKTVFGEGVVDAALILVGEQPGDHEDRQGHPFVGPAGAVLWQCLDDAGIDRRSLYVTNAVKHFKHERHGTRRLHKKPSTAEVKACHPWLAAELEAVRAPVVVALGATAARSVLGRTVGVNASRGRPFATGDRTAFVTFHPSAVLRATDDAAQIRAALVDDLRAAAAGT
jgi:uracil-DNA glycosylase